MLTSAGGILALLKDQNQVRRTRFLFPPIDFATSGGAVEGAADPVCLEEAGLGGRRVLG